MKVAYIGSPFNLQDQKVKAIIAELLNHLSSRGVDIYVGPPNAMLKAEADNPDRVFVQDMKETECDMFNVIIITPGRLATEEEAKRFDGHATIFNFKNLASESGSPAWFDSLSCKHTFDLNELQVESVVNTMMRDDGPVESEVPANRHASEEDNDDVGHEGKMDREEWAKRSAEHWSRLSKKRRWR